MAVVIDESVKPSQESKRGDAINLAGQHITAPVTVICMPASQGHAAASLLPAIRPGISPSVERHLNAILSGEVPFISRFTNSDRETVRFIQQLLNYVDPKLIHDIDQRLRPVADGNKLTENGEFGAQLEWAVGIFQRHHATEVSYIQRSRRQVDDGKIGKRTLGAMLRAAGFDLNDAGLLHLNDAGMEEPVAVRNNADSAEAVRASGSDILKATCRRGTDEAALCSALLSLSPSGIANLRERLAMGELSDPSGRAINTTLDALIRRECSGQLRKALLRYANLPLDTEPDMVQKVRTGVWDGLRAQANSTSVPWTDVARHLELAGELSPSDLAAACRVSLRKENFEDSYFKEALDNMKTNKGIAVADFVAAYGRQELRNDIALNLPIETRVKILKDLSIEAP